MADYTWGGGVTFTASIDLGAPKPVDSRIVCNTIEERDAHVANNRVYPGMEIFVIEDQKTYRYAGSSLWDTVPNKTDVLTLVGESSKMVVGYYHNGEFYKDSAHTEVITPSDKYFYVDKTISTNYQLYKYDSEATTPGYVIFNKVSLDPGIETAAYTVGGITSGDDLEGMDVKEVLAQMLGGVSGTQVKNMTFTAEKGVPQEYGTGSNYITAVTVTWVNGPEPVTSLALSDGRSASFTVTVPSGATSHTINTSSFGGRGVPVASDEVVEWVVIAGTASTATAYTKSYQNVYNYPYYVGYWDNSIEDLPATWITSDSTFKVGMQDNFGGDITYTINNTKIFFAYPGSGLTYKIYDETGTVNLTSSFKTKTLELSVPRTSEESPEWGPTVFTVFLGPKWTSGRAYTYKVELS